MILEGDEYPVGGLITGKQHTEIATHSQLSGGSGNVGSCAASLFEMPSGWGWYMYAIADDGERIRCPHPSERGKAREVIGTDASEEEIDRRTGIHDRCFCRDCHEQVDLDPERDGKNCPYCQSTAVNDLEELVDDLCPVCEEGVVVSEDTGAIA